MEDLKKLAGHFQISIANETFYQRQSEVIKKYNIDDTKYKTSKFTGKKLVPSDCKTCPICHRHNTSDKRPLEVYLLNNLESKLETAKSIVYCTCRDEGKLMTEDEKFNYTLFNYPHNLPFVTDEKNFDNYNITKDTETAHSVARKYCERIINGEQVVLLMIGSVGTGKTHLMSAIGHELLKHKILVRYDMTSQMLDKFRESISNQDQDLSQILSMYRKYKVLMLDDIGVEKPSEWVTDRLQVLFDSRILNSTGSMVIATNLNRQDLSTRLGARIGSRLWDSSSNKFMRIVINTKDYRLK